MPGENSEGKKEEQECTGLAFRFHACFTRAGKRCQRVKLEEVPPDPSQTSFHSGRNVIIGFRILFIYVYKQV